MATIAEVKDFMSDRSRVNRTVKKEVDDLLTEKETALRNEATRDELHRLRLEVGMLKDSVMWLRHEMRTLFAILYERREAVDAYCESYRENVLPERIAESAQSQAMKAMPEENQRKPEGPIEPRQPDPPPAQHRREQKGSKKWITNGQESKKVPVDEALPPGWIPGRANAFGKDKHMDIADRSQQEQEEFQAQALAAHFNSRRLDTPVQGEKGICLDCGKPIHPDRFRFVKNAVRCARCQREHEGPIR